MPATSGEGQISAGGGDGDGSGGGEQREHMPQVSRQYPSAFSRRSAHLPLLSCSAQVGLAQSDGGCTSLQDAEQGGGCGGGVDGGVGGDLSEHESVGSVKPDGHGRGQSEVVLQYCHI